MARSRFLGLWIWVLLAAWLAGETPSNPADRVGSPNPEIQALIDAMGGVTFRTRERASRQITDWGLDALPALMANQSHADREVRERVAAAIFEIRQVCQPALIQEFLANGRVDPRLPLPGWPTLRQAVGDSIDSRQLMGSILLAEWSFLQQCEKSPDPASLLVGRADTVLRGRARSVRSTHLSIPSISALLLVAIQFPKECSKNQQVAIRLTNLLNLGLRSPESAEWIRESEPIARLLGTYLELPCDPLVLPSRLQFCIHHRLPQSLHLARQLLVASDGNPMQRVFAITTLGEFGSEEEIDILEKYLEDETPLRPQMRLPQDANKPKSPPASQIRDAALGAIIHLAGLDAADFQMTPWDGLRMRTRRAAGFATEEARAAAIRRWRNMRSATLLIPYVNF